jgi:DNA-binding MarR family transcriptional regulator
MNALDTNRNRKNGGVIDWTVSGFRVARPIAANTHVLALAGPLTAGELAQRTGLTTGATTRMIDRLESEGFVRRVPDQADRRRVIVETLPDRDSDINAALEPARLAMFEVFKKNSTPASCGLFLTTSPPQLRRSSLRSKSFVERASDGGGRPL